MSFTKDVSVDLDNCTIANNTSDKDFGGGIYIDNSSKVTVAGSIISGNTGYGIYEDYTGESGSSYGGESEVEYSLFHQNTEGDLYDVQTGESVSGSGDLDDTRNEDPNDILYGYVHIKNGDPMYVKGNLGKYYLDPTSVAVDPVFVSSSYLMANEVVKKKFLPNGTEIEVTLADLTTAKDEMLDAGKVDLGYHYKLRDPNELYSFAAKIVDENDDLLWAAGSINPENDNFYRGQIVEVDASVYDEYYLLGWSGGTINDNSQQPSNSVVMTRPKDIGLQVRLRKTLTVGSSPEYATLGDASGTYTAPSQFPSSLNSIDLNGTNVTISGTDTHNEAVVRATVFDSYAFDLDNLDETTVIEGITLNGSNMSLNNANPIIRNCVFTNCHFVRMQLVHLADPPVGGDGYHQNPIFGGAMSLVDSSPQVTSCTFENNSVTGAAGENGFEGGEEHPDSGDGGWPSPTYGGAVYCGFSSKPVFTNCTFTGNEAFGAAGGNGADYVTVDDVPYMGGRGGGWVYDDSNEDYLENTLGWDGWTYGVPGTKYSNYYALYFGEYDLAKWRRWFDWDASYTSWDDIIANPPNDPHDQMLESWRFNAYGGAVYCEFESSATFVDCVFADNQTHGGTTGQGGSHYLQSPWPDRPLAMPTGGGAVFATDDSDLEFTNCRFTGNLVNSADVVLPHTFQTSFGGAVGFKRNCDVKFTGCVLEENNASVGGGIYAYEAAVTVTDCNVMANEAFYGGGIFLDQGNMGHYDDDDSDLLIPNAVISESLIHQNIVKIPDVEVVVPDDPDGGQEPVVSGSELDATGVGAGLMAVSMELTVVDTAFIDNISGLSGGGMMLMGTVLEPTDIFNCLFAGNSADADGGGASVKLSSRADFINCTFAGNSSDGEVEAGGSAQNGEDEMLYPGAGGGLYCAYDTVVDVNDSIFWGNYVSDEGTGSQIQVGTGDPYAPHETVLNITYSSVDDYPGGNAIYEAYGSVANVGAGVAELDPSFEVLPGEESQKQFHYYLNQDLTECKDAGSGFAYLRGLDRYTTSILGGGDRGLVDLGYHYPQHAPKISCSYVDFELTGSIDLADWAFFASEWLSEPCGEAGNWCNGVDLNYDSAIDLFDLITFSSCWLEKDTEAPEPNAVTWEMPPTSPAGTFGTIEMIATKVNDNWWPDGDIEYFFECRDYPYLGSGSDPNNFADWTTSRDLTVTIPVGVHSDFVYYVYAKDGSGNITAKSDKVIVTPGENHPIPKSLWLADEFGGPVGEPDSTVYDFDTGSGLELAVVMTATAFDGIPGTIPVDEARGYSIKYQFMKNDVDESEFYDSPVLYDKDGRIDEDPSVAVGDVHEYRIRMGLFHASTDTPITTGDYSDPVTVTIVAADTLPPTPNPARHVVGTPAGSVSGENRWVYVRAVPATDQPAGSGYEVEYKFVCLTTSNLDSDWRSLTSVAGTVYNDGTAQIPELYEVFTTSTGFADRWVIYYRDTSPLKNTTYASDVHSVSQPENGTYGINDDGSANPNGDGGGAAQ
jgi:hypothetical protein